MLIEQAGQLEQFYWFVRAHLENSSGELTTGNAKTRTQRCRPRDPPITPKTAHDPDQRAEPS
jgi:hypothetical protein